MTDALLLTMMNPPPEGDAEFNAWVDTEHLPERRSIPGFRTTMRFRNKVRNKVSSPRYMAIYDLEDFSILQSPAYAAIAGDNLSPWSKRILAGASARWRFEGSRVGPAAEAPRTGGKGNFAELLLVGWRGLPAACDDAILAVLNDAFGNAPGVVQWRAFVGQRDGRTDYVGIVESAQPFDSAVADPARYSTASHPGDFAHVFLPIRADD